MSRQIISLSFTLLFALFLTVPPVIVMLDDSVDISIIYGSAEEEEKGSKKNKELEVLFFELDPNVDGMDNLSNKNLSNYFFKNYSNPHLNLLSPPPEYNIL
jgi:hypothetical protein